MLIINFIQRKGTQKAWSLYKVVPNKSNIVNYMMLTYKNKDKPIKENYNRQWQTHTEKNINTKTILYQEKRCNLPASTNFVHRSYIDLL